ncbi:MAG TPA: IPT/TIG domain-containing protein [Candidatus Eisenbacteria bacterium]|nr:IPT/TIG domain-containing protein [Candidatus Eisenbacteria bacterium]
MVAITVDETNVGQIVASNGILTDLVLKIVPTQYGNDYLLVVDQVMGKDDQNNDIVLGETQLYNRCISKAYVSMNSILFTNGQYPFANLIVKTIPPGCSVEIITADPPPAPTLTTLVPNTYDTDGIPFTLSCQGTGFTADAIIQIGDSDVPTMFISDTELNTNLNPNAYLTGDYQVQIHIGAFYTDSLNFTFI